MNVMPIRQLSQEQQRAVDQIAPPEDHTSDETIITRVLNGDVQAYGLIMRRYNQRMFRLARSIATNDAVAMDVVQEAHIKAFHKLDTFRGTSNFLSWLFAITRNEALMLLRKTKKTVSMDDDRHHCSNEPHSEEREAIRQQPNRSPDALLENQQLKSLINQNVDDLPEDYRIVFVLRSIEQLSVRETADILQVQEATVKTRHFRGKRLIRESIQKYLDQVGLHVYEFGGRHCDIIINNVLTILQFKP